MRCILLVYGKMIFWEACHGSQRQGSAQSRKHTPASHRNHGTPPSPPGYGLRSTQLLSTTIKTGLNEASAVFNLKDAWTDLHGLGPFRRVFGGEIILSSWTRTVTVSEANAIFPDQTDMAELSDGVKFY